MDESNLEFRRDAVSDVFLFIFFNDQAAFLFLPVKRKNSVSLALIPIENLLHKLSSALW